MLEAIKVEDLIEVLLVENAPSVYSHDTTSIRTGRLEVRVTKILRCEPDPRGGDGRQDTGTYNVVVMTRQGDILSSGRGSGGQAARADGLEIAQCELEVFLHDHEEWR